MYACVVCRVRDDWTGRGCKGCVWEGANERDTVTQRREESVKRSGVLFYGAAPAERRGRCDIYSPGPWTTWSALGVHSALNTSMMMRCAERAPLPRLRGTSRRLVACAPREATEADGDHTALFL
jgi:hypothetical protein